MTYHIEVKSPVSKNLFVKNWQTGNNELYLTRIELMPMSRWGQLCLHIFHRADAPSMAYHSHPYDFWSWGFWGWYQEEFLCPIDGKPKWFRTKKGPKERIVGMWSIKPFRVVEHRAEHAHKIIYVSRWGCIRFMWRKPDRCEWYLYHQDGSITLGNDKGRARHQAPRENN